MNKLVILGGGTCGVMCASILSQAKLNNLEITIIDKQDKLLSKLEASGNGRCNVTNNKELKEFLTHIDNPKYFYPLLKNFGPAQIISYMNELGVELKEEKNNKMFPVTNKSTTISEALKNTLNNVELMFHTKVNSIKYEDNQYILDTSNGIVTCDYLVLSFGGMTYSNFGSDKNNFRMLEALDLKVEKLTPQECSIQVKEPLSNLMGISLVDTNIVLRDKDKIIDKLNGDILFTHFGLSGPGILNTSFTINKHHHENIFISLQLLNKDYEDCKQYIYQIIKDYPNKNMFNCLNQLPNRLLEYILDTLEIKDIKNTHLNKKQINELIHQLSSFTLQFKSFFKPEMAFVTSGGLSLKELKPKTLESKKYPNLYFGGEMIDVCGQLGGYNITLALSCGYNIAQDIINKLSD